MKKENYIRKWDEVVSENDLLVKYHAKDFKEIVIEGIEIKEVDSDLVIRILKQITVMREGKLVVLFVDGSGIVM